VYVPADTLATTNEAVRVPPEIEHVLDPTGLPESEQLESLDEKLEPETDTSNPTELEVGLSVIVGVPPMTERAARAESPT
jgi:hypothetical protein